MTQTQVMAIMELAKDLASFNGRDWNLLQQDQKDIYIAVATKLLDKYDLIRK